MQCVQVIWFDPGTWIHSAHPFDAVELHEVLQVSSTHPLLQGGAGAGYDVTAIRSAVPATLGGANASRAVRCTYTMLNYILLQYSYDVRMHIDIKHPSELTK